MSFGGPQLHFVTGKGGVGKSILALSLAQNLAKQGRRVLLSELGEHSVLSSLFNQNIGMKPTILSENLSAVRWDGEGCLKEYILHYVKVEKMVDLFFENRVMKALVQAAPALKELAILGKITSANRKIGPTLQYDDIVIDAFATGHFKALLQAPVGMAEAVQIGPMGEQCRSIQAVIQDQQVTKIYIAMIPEELPVTEGLELSEYLENNFQNNICIVKNRWIKSPITRESLTKIDQPFAHFLERQLKRQDFFEQRLRNSPRQIEMPFYFIPASVELAKSLATNWGSR